MRKAVLHFSAFSAPYKGNFMSSLINLEELLLKDEIETVYVFEQKTAQLQWAQQMADEGKNVYFLSGDTMRDVALLRNIFKKHNVKLLHSHFSETKYNLIIKLARIGLDVAWVRHVHSAYKYAGRLKEPIKRFIESADYIIACSENIEKAMLDTKIRPDKIECVYNGIDFSRLDVYEPLTHDELGIGAGTAVAMMLGYNVRIKGVDVMLDALVKVRQIKDVCLMLVVASNLEGVKEDITKHMGAIPPWLIICPPRSDIATYYRAADIFVSSSRTEGFCYALNEARYCERFVIASDITGHAKVPYMFESGNSDELAKKILAALEMDEQEKCAMLQEQKKLVVDNFSVDAWSRRIYDIYKKRFGI